MFKMEVDKADVAKIVSALDRISNTVKVQGMDTMLFKCATDYYQLVMKNIMGMNLARPAYSERYRNWKYEYGWMGYPSPWRLKGDLVKSLGAHKQKNGYLGGVEPGAMDTGGKSWHGKGKVDPKGKSKPIEMYGRVSEFGSKKRPVFVPSMEEYETNGFLKRGDEMLKAIENEWR